MLSWLRDLKRRRLIRIETDPKMEPKPMPKPELNRKEIAQERTLKDIFYPPKTALASCFNFPNLGPNVTFELRPL